MREPGKALEEVLDLLLGQAVGTGDELLDQLRLREHVTPSGLSGRMVTNAARPGSHPCDERRGSAGHHHTGVTAALKHLRFRTPAEMPRHDPPILELARVEIGPAATS
ncbi:hypothetical protein TBR22_A09220 [Luteitalea sp. TBR-22]|nr:hypothetical protein TBR22_A09220 [Luteitalea sp. TBR-22]